MDHTCVSAGVPKADGNFLWFHEILFQSGRAIMLLLSLWHINFKGYWHALSPFYLHRLCQNIQEISLQGNGRRIVEHHSKIFWYNKFIRFIPLHTIKWKAFKEVPWIVFKTKTDKFPTCSDGSKQDKFLIWSLICYKTR